MARGILIVGLIASVAATAQASDIKTRPGYASYVSTADRCSKLYVGAEIAQAQASFKKPNREVTAVTEDRVAARLKAGPTCLTRLANDLAFITKSPEGAAKFGNAADYDTDIRARRANLERSFRAELNALGYVRSGARIRPVTPGYFYCRIEYENADYATVGRFLTKVLPDADIEDTPFDMTIFRSSPQSNYQLKMAADYVRWIEKNYTVSGRPASSFKPDVWCIGVPSRARADQLLAQEKAENVGHISFADYPR